MGSQCFVLSFTFAIYTSATIFFNGEQIQTATQGAREVAVTVQKGINHIRARVQSSNYRHGSGGFVGALWQTTTNPLVVTDASWGYSEIGDLFPL